MTLSPRTRRRINDVTRWILPWRAPYRLWLHYYQRAQRGWSYRDLWSFDDHLARVIGGGVAELRQVGHGYPSNLTPERWDEIQDQMSAGFLAYARRWDAPRGESYEEYKARMDEGEQGVRDALAVMETAWPLFREHFMSLWD